MRLLVFGVWLMIAGCGGAIFAGGTFPIHPRPLPPKALVSPEKTFVKCGEYLCVTPEDLESLRKWVVRIQGVVEKYENATKAINNAGP